MSLLPATPTQFTVQQGNDQVWLTWLQVPGITSYTLQRSTDNITFATIASPVVGQYLDTSVVSGTQYWYQVASVSATGTSPFTPSQSIVPTPTGKLSLGQVRLMAQQRADRVNSQFVTPPEWNTYINQSAFELYDLLVQKYGNEYFLASPYQFATTGARFYDLPSDLYKLLGVDLNVNGTNNNSWITLKKFEFISRNTNVYPQITTNLLGVAGMRYRLMGNQIEFDVAPSSGQIIQLWYIPKLTQLLKDTDIMDGISGWTEYVIIDAAIKALQKEESDVTVLALQKAAMIQRIDSAAENRDAGEPETISNTRRATDLWGFGNYGGGSNFGGF